MTFPLLSALRMSSASSAEPRGAEITTSDGRALPLRGVALKIEARGGLARATLEQRYENAFDEALHVTYRMPLPADGAVSGYAFEIGERKIAGVVDRKAAAREKFERAIAAGNTAALLEQERDDIFTQKIGNIPPRATIVAKISVDLRLAWLPEGEWELRFPTVIGPRYSTTLADRAATGVTIGGVAARMFVEVAIGDELGDGRKASSPTHRLEQTGGVVALAEPSKLDRDLVIRWPVATPSIGASLATARPATGAHAEHAYGLLSIVPPAAVTRAISRDLLILLDTSGSMGGAPLDKAKQVLPLLIETLGEGDRLEVIEFANEPRRWKEAPVAVTPKEKAEAIKWIKSRKADGGTEMRTAVIEALSTLRLGAQRQVILVSDGYVGGEQQILEVLHARLPKSCRLHYLGVGSAVNRSLAAALARAGRGVEVIVGPDEDAERGAKRLLDRTKLPVLTNVELSGTALVRHVPEHLPDVFAGAPLVAAVALSPDGGELVVRGEVSGETWVHRVKVPATSCGDGSPAVVALFGREHVADLESRAAAGKNLDREIETTGVSFQIATRLTSWVAVDDSRVVAGPGRDVEVPQELPYGTTAAAFGLRTGAVAPAQGMMKTMMVGLADDAALDDLEMGGAPGSADFNAEEITGSLDLRVMRAPAPAQPMRPRVQTRTGAMFAQAERAPASIAKKRGRPFAWYALLAMILGLIGVLLWWLLG